MGKREHSDRPRICDYVFIDELQSQFADIFPTVESIKEYVTKWRGWLYSDRAIILINGRARFHPKRFERVLIDQAAFAVLVKSIEGGP